MENKRIKFIVKGIAAALLLVAAYHLVTRKEEPKLPAVTAPLVATAHPQILPMAEYVRQTGNTVAFNSVNLVARVEGYLQGIEFIDGSFIKKDQLLFVIEPEPYLEKVKEAEASVKAQKAGYAYAEAEHARQKEMYKENATALKNVEKWAANEEESQAEVAKAEANEVIAKINYSYTHVLAPFDGRIGRHLVDIGNLVGHGEATSLATVEQIKPIYVYFNLNEIDLIKLREAARKRGFKPYQIDKIPVFVGLQNEKGYPHQGKLNFVNTGLNASTGTMQFRAILANEDYDLVPGLFTRVRIPVDEPKPQLTIPDSAVQYDQIGPYVLTVDKDHFVVLRRVVLGSLESGRRAIKKGLAADDEVIVDGIQNAVPGNQVQVKTEAAGQKGNAGK